MLSITGSSGSPIPSVISSVAFAVSAISVVVQLRQVARGRYFSVTAHLF